MAGQRIYLDHAATTPILPAARAAMADGLERWANPSSPHAEGRAAKAALEHARVRLQSALGWSPGGKGGLLFTSGATEALGLAIGHDGSAVRLASDVEHDAVFRAAAIRNRIRVESNGVIDLEDLRSELARLERPALVIVQAVNNETGIIQPLAEVAEIVWNGGGRLLVDCAQSGGRLPLPNADYIAISGHKLGAPPGIGALLVKDWSGLYPVGGQERGYRPGTENVPAAAAFATAAEAGSDWWDEAADLRMKLDEFVIARGGEIVGAHVPRAPSISGYRMPGVPATSQLIQFDLAGIAVSAGSACSSGTLKPSRILSAMGWSEASAREVVRVSFGRTTTRSDLDRFCHVWAHLAEKSRAA